MRKEIWIRTEKEFVDDVKEVIMSLIKERDGLAGDLSVKIFTSDTREVCVLSHIYDLSETAVNILKEHYGDDNVKFCDRREREDKDFMEAVSDIWHKLDMLRSQGINAKDGLTVLLLMELQGINFALNHEGAVGQSLEILAGCVSDRNQFCAAADVTGEISTCNY